MRQNHCLELYHVTFLDMGEVINYISAITKLLNVCDETNNLGFDWAI